LETLEERALLAADLPVGGEWIDWGGRQVAVSAGSWIITFDERLTNQNAELMAREVATRLGVSATDFRSVARGSYATFHSNDRITAQQANLLAADLPMVQAIEPNQIYQTSRVPNDPRFGEQYFLQNTGQIIPQPTGFLGTAGADIHATEAWEVTIGSRDVVVAVIDTGVDLDHPDLAANIWINPGEVAGNGLDDDGNGLVDDVNGYDFGTLDSDPSDERSGGHGSLVAGSIGAVGNNGIGVSGVAWNVSIMALKIADAFGGLSTAAIVGAHDYATMMRTDYGINVVASNNSYGAFQPTFFDNDNNVSSAERAAIQRFIASGGIFVAAAGNAGNDNDAVFTSYPASYNVPGVISVGASDNNDGIAGFSNYGAESVDLFAPGVDILTTTYDGSYAYVDGTSFSSPIVVGAIALLKTVKPNASAVEIREALINSADPLPAFQGKSRSGGRLNIAEALRIIGISGPVLNSVSPGPVVGQINPTTGQPFNRIVATFSKDIAPASLTFSTASLRGAGLDDAFGTGDDVTVPISSIFRDPSNARSVVFVLNLTGFTQVRLPVDLYELTLEGTGTAGVGIRDTLGNFLNGNTVSGNDEVYGFRIVASTGDFEPNDQFSEATPIAFDATGQARYTGVTLGNGIYSNLDVDIYRINLARGGLITAEITAQRLASPSTLDSYMRLFNASGEQLAFNDQFFGRDSFIDFFVSTGGVYFIAVSGFGNETFNPAVGGSGSTQSLGAYNLAVQVQLQNDDVVGYNSTDHSPPTQPAFPRPIPAAAPTQSQGTTIAQIIITDTREVLDLNLRLDITHPFTNDLIISLISPATALDPAGREVVMVNRRGGSGNNFTSTLFDDEASQAITAASAPYSGSFRPENALGFFDGLREGGVAGVWTLRIQDVTPLNIGTLNSWSLDFTFQNNIFGFYELNDTITTANFVDEFSGVGTASRTAFIGDGGFGALDRDIFRFTAESGASLTATVRPVVLDSMNEFVPGGTLNTMLRLFDALGNEILNSNPATTLTSAVNGYVFANGGTYYIAVSESNNPLYTLSVAGSGATAITTGYYTLDITLAAGVSDPSFVLQGNAVSVGINQSGIFTGPSQGGGTTRLDFNGIEFLPANSQQFFGVVASGSNFTNNTTSSGLPFALTSSGDSTNNRVSMQGTFRGLKIERTLSFGLNDSFIAIDVFLTNTTTGTLDDIGWMEGFNPGQGIGLGENNPNTSNDVDSNNHRATARYANNQYAAGLTVSLAAPTADARAKASVLGEFTVVRDPSQLLNAPVIDPNGSTSDGQLTMAFDVGDVTAGTTVSMRYFIFFGDTPSQADALYAAVNNRTGHGHLAAKSDLPVRDALSDGTLVPDLPYKVYFPEGFVGNNIFTYMPLANLTDQYNRLYVIAHYEFGPIAERDQLIGSANLAPNARGGYTIITPDLLANNQQLVRAGAGPYALEVRSERPVAATFSHYDTALLGGLHSAVGEAFTSRTSDVWSFGRVTKGPGVADYVLIYVPGAESTSVVMNFYPLAGGAPVQIAFALGEFRRGGLDINSRPELADGDYGVVVQTSVPVVASLTHYGAAEGNSLGAIGNPGLGAATGVVPEGQFGLNSQADTLSVLNATGTNAQVIFSFLFSNGSAYRTALDVPANSNRMLEVADLTNFPTGQPYGVYYESNTPISLSSVSRSFNDAEGSATADRAYTLWGFAEGFRPGDSDGHSGVTETLRLYNPSSTDVIVEVTIGYDPGSSETFRRTLPARRVTEFNVDEFVTGLRRDSFSFYNLQIKAPTPIVASMIHFDSAFLGAFGTLGTPFGLFQDVT